jgi:hypothetical protein
MLKNESAQNDETNAIVDSGGIFTLSNGVHMKKISHSDRKVKHKKSVDCPYRTRLYRTRGMSI